MCKLVIMAGLPASGKTTYVNKVAKTEDIVHISMDAIRGEIFGDEAIQYTPELGDKILRDKSINTDGVSEEEMEKKRRWACGNMIFNLSLKRCIDALSDGKTVYYDAMSINRRNRKNIISKTKSICRNIECVAFIPDRELCLERNRKRERHVPESVITDTVFVMPTLDEGFSKITKISLDGEVASIDEA